MAVGNLTAQMEPGLMGVNSKGLELFACSFETVDGADPTNLKGENVEVSRGAEGEWDIKLPVQYEQMICCIGSVEGTSEETAYFEVDSYTKSTRTVKVRTMLLADAADPADADDIPGARVNVILVMRRSPELSRTWT